MGAEETVTALFRGKAKVARVTRDGKHVMLTRDEVANLINHDDGLVQALRHVLWCAEDGTTCQHADHKMAMYYIHQQRVSETQKIIDASYGTCAGCGGQEPREVLDQMDGYCSSECAREAAQ